MPALRLQAIEVSDTTLDLIEEKLGYSSYELMELLEEAAKEKLDELRQWAKEK